MTRWGAYAAGGVRSGRPAGDVGKREGEEPMRAALYRMSGVDMTSIDAIGASVDGRTNFSYKFNCRGNFSLADEVWIEARMHDILALYT